MALGSAMPHTACQSDFAVACAGLVGKNILVYCTGSSSGFSDGQSPGSEVRSEHKRSKANDSTEREENPRQRICLLFLAS